jgi:hypothetical protein
MSPMRRIIRMGARTTWRRGHRREASRDHRPILQTAPLAANGLSGTCPVGIQQATPRCDGTLRLCPPARAKALGMRYEHARTPARVDQGCRKPGSGPQGHRTSASPVAPYRASGRQRSGARADGRLTALAATAGPDVEAIGRRGFRRPGTAAVRDRGVHRPPALPAAWYQCVTRAQLTQNSLPSGSCMTT